MNIRALLSHFANGGADSIPNAPDRCAGRRKGSVFLNTVCVLCILFGVALILEVQTPNEGTWYWYAYFFQHGKHLYSDMHLSLQPFYVLETSWFLRLTSNSWLASKIPAVFHDVIYCIGLLLILRQTRLSDARRAIMFGCVFTVSLCAVMVRFDDYHVVSECLLLYSAALLLAIQRLRDIRAILIAAAVLGVLSGLAVENRINDGAALFAGVGTALVCMAPAKRMMAAALFVVAACVTALLVVRLTGDLFHDYAANSIFHAAAAKGGTSSIFAYPFEVPGNAYRWTLKYGRLPIILITFTIALIWAFMIRPLTRNLTPPTLGLAAFGILITIRMIAPQSPEIVQGAAIPSVSAVGVYLLYGAGFMLLYRGFRWLAHSRSSDGWDAREALYLLPLGYLVSMSTSSAGSHLGTYAWFVLGMLVASIMQPEQHWPEWLSQSFFAVAVILTIYAVCFKALVPYNWHTYRSPSLFSRRVWYRHPVYGPMLIEKSELDFIEPVCRDIRANGGQVELLSLPYGYANYFCDVPPWHTYVQTFFDTSAPATIYGLMGELETNPPKWIFYQRQISTLRLHEEIYNHGQPLPHRYLDILIEQKISQGLWRVVYDSDYGTSASASSQWLLISTRESSAK